MEPTVNQILQQAIASHKEGKIEEAEKSYKKAIELKPDFPEAHYNLVCYPSYYKLQHNMA